MRLRCARTSRSNDPGCAHNRSSASAGAHAGKVRRGGLVNFTGIDSPYEPPEAAELRLDTMRLSPADSVDAILDRLG